MCRISDRICIKYTVIEYIAIAYIKWIKGCIYRTRVSDRELAVACNSID